MSSSGSQYPVSAAVGQLISPVLPGVEAIIAQQVSATAFGVVQGAGYNGDGGGTPTGAVAVVPYGLTDGTHADRMRTPNVFKNLSAVVITNETTIWTPASGKKFRIMGVVLDQGVASGVVTLRDNTAGSTILLLPAEPVGTNTYFTIGNGILSAAANNVLTAQGVATETLTGFVFGTEE